MNNTKGIIVIISGPSGSGKGTIVKELMKNKRYALSISATTRQPRVGEEEGVHYFFKSKTEFEKMMEKDDLIEWAEFCENYYGTPKSYVEQMQLEGKDVILEIEVQGALKVKKLNPEAVLIFIVPPSFRELRSRLVGRGTEQEEIVEKRLKRALEEFDMIEQYDYVVINDKLSEAVERIHTIIMAEHMKATRNLNVIEQIKKE